MSKVVLIITDGIGYARETAYNAFFNAKKPTYDDLFKNVPYSLIHTYGMSVGLPEGQMGNSEVGHMTIGAGRIMYQDLVKITKAIEEKSIGQNPAFSQALAQGKRIHIVGLLSDGGVHSHLLHLKGLARIAAAKGKQVFLHMITDGRDVSPTSAPEYLKALEPILGEKIVLATLSGRYYTMDRDKRWERVEQGYLPIVEGSNPTTLSPEAYIRDQYAKAVTDEFIEPASFGHYGGMEDGDAVVMANFRSDRVRQITQLLGDPGFMPVDVPKRNLHIVTMTEYAKTFDFPVMFPKESPENTLAQVISEAGRSQFHTAETEKYAHVTFFLNGGIEEPYPNETRVLIPSPKVATYDLQPEMSADAVGDAVVKGITEGYDFVVVNFANGDMVGHTGNYEAALKAVEAVDRNLGKVMEAAETHGYRLILTSDHGNCEAMRDEAGNILTNHTVGDVFCFVKAPGVEAVKTGGLANIASTVLKLMELPIPREMETPLI